MILVIDNYDSFTYNIVQYLGEMGTEMKIWRNDTFTLDELKILKPEAIILSPGPGHPINAGLTCDVIREFTGIIPILGVCLGHQAIGLVNGGKVVEAEVQLHGKISNINLNEDRLFKDMPSNIDVVRYHSLVIDKATIPSQLEVISSDENGEIMAIKHREHPVYGVQFHPESYSTQNGKRILRNFLDIAESRRKNLCKTT